MGQKYRLHHDFETYSDADISNVGGSRYARDSSTENLMLSYALNDEPVQQWVKEEGERMPSDLKQAIHDPDCVKFAWNKSFEHAIWECVEGVFVPHNQWRDPMVLASTLSLPMSLDACGEVIGLPDDRKKTKGKALIRKWSCPRKPTKKNPKTRLYWYEDPESWGEYKAYNVQDTTAERSVWHKLRPYNMPLDEWEMWFLDQEINHRGLPINMEMVDNCVRLVEEFTARGLARMQDITGLANANSNATLLEWLKANGYPFFDLRAPTVKKALEYVDKPPAHWNDERRAVQYHPGYVEVLKLRQQVSRTSVKKYAALQRATDRDCGVIRNTLQFAGAGRTWRWSGRIYQPQNLAKPTKEFEKPELQLLLAEHLTKLDADQFDMIYGNDIMGALATGIRMSVQAPEGQVFADADLNAIENRVLGWMAQDEKILEVFSSGRDPYVDFAKYMYRQPYEELFEEYKVGGNKKKRQTAKPAVLGCGYMLSPGKEYEDYRTGETMGTGLIGYALNMGIKLTPEEAELAVKTWRTTFERAVEFWWEIDAAARRCIRTGDRQECWPVAFDRKGPFLRMILPSGRALHYCRPRLEDWLMPWGEYKLSITYEGLNDQNQWERMSTHPGKLTENADQAISRDFLAHGIKLALAEGLDVRLHVHDQILALVLQRLGERGLEILKRCMSTCPPWGQAGRISPMPLAADGIVSRVYIKD